MRQEIEILWELNMPLADALVCLSSLKHTKTTTTLDTYYYDPLRSDLKPNHNGKILKCLRVREAHKQHSITYKTDHYDGNVWQYSDEAEADISDSSSISEIIKLLGLLELVKIMNKKHKFVDENKNFEIVLEEVDGLGNFVEIEWKGDSNLSHTAAKDFIRNFVSGFGLRLGEELNSGKPELMLKKFIKTGNTHWL